MACWHPTPSGEWRAKDHRRNPRTSGDREAPFAPGSASQRAAPGAGPWVAAAGGQTAAFHHHAGGAERRAAGAARVRAWWRPGSLPRRTGQPWGARCESVTSGLRSALDGPLSNPRTTGWMSGRGLGVHEMRLDFLFFRLQRLLLHWAQFDLRAVGQDHAWRCHAALNCRLVAQHGRHRLQTRQVLPLAWPWISRFHDHAAFTTEPALRCRGYLKSSPALRLG